MGDCSLVDDPRALVLFLASTRLPTPGREAAGRRMIRGPSGGAVTRSLCGLASIIGLALNRLGFASIARDPGNDRDMVSPKALENTCPGAYGCCRSSVVEPNPWDASTPRNSNPSVRAFCVKNCGGGAHCSPNGRFSAALFLFGSFLGWAVCGRNSR